MAELESALAGVHAATIAFLACVDGAAVVWTVPRAPGKWSPAQLVEHVSRIMEESANVATGAPSKFPTIPGLLRPIVRALMFHRILKKNAFSKMTASPAFDPATGPASPTEGRRRLEGALVRYEQACRSRVASGQEVVSSIFGAVPVAEFARFQELHVRHHLPQMPAAG